MLNTLIIGGLTAAITLRQKGFKIQVYEAVTELQPMGKGIWMPLNAMQVFECFGISDAIMQSGFALSSFRNLLHESIKEIHKK
jgi:2-polyprenyl-6-methoxyphenol hydroxylase-like FAD-dependent oxidoreductase